MKRSIVAGIIFLMFLQAIGFVGAVDSYDYSKIVIVNLNINTRGITEKSVEMRYGHAPNLEARSGDFTGILKSSDGSVIREFDLWDPRYQLGDVLEKNNESSLYLSGYLVHSDDADLTLILPYYENQVTLELKDKKTGALVKEVNMTPAIIKFQSAYPKDPGNFSVSPVKFDKTVIEPILGIVISILLIGIILSIARKK
jgi:hypothetical protein